MFVGTEISISGVQGVSNATVNGLTFYLSITANYALSGNVALYTDFARILPTNGTAVTYTNAPNAIAINPKIAAVLIIFLSMINKNVSTKISLYNLVLKNYSILTFKYKFHFLTI